MTEGLDRHRLLQAFHRLGEDLAVRGLFIELAVYGGSALMLQFAWRLSTRDVDAVVREGHDESLLAAASARVAAVMKLEPDWLNNAVGQFTPLREDETLFALAGTYPASSSPGLRVLVAKPHYLLAMKLLALRSHDRGDRDMADAQALALHLDIADEAALERLYRSIHDEPPPPEVRMRFSTVLGRST
jgi:hypothetical protein